MQIPKVLAALRTALPAGTTQCGLHEPWLNGNEAAYVLECIATGWVSSVGSFVDRFERDLAACTGARRAVAVVNGTAGLHLALEAVGVQPGDEVLIPTLTFIATANAVSYCHATPHFCDSEFATLGIDAAKLGSYLEANAEVRGGGCFNRRTGAHIRAIVPMHTFGHAVDLDALLRVADRFQLAVVEDAAESLGSRYRGRHTGTFGRIGVLSFNGNKVVTTGGGGALITNDEALGERLKHLSTTARLRHRWSFLHDEVGYNYRLPNLNAALGCAQLERLDEFVARKRNLARKYREAMHGIDGVRFFSAPAHSESNYWLNTLLLDPQFAARRDELLDALNEAGLMARPVWTLMHRLPMYQACPRMDLAVAEDIERRLVNIPSSAFLAEP